MDEFDLEIKKEFINEALMNLEEAEGSFMELETASDKKPLLDKIFRLAHNLKGGSRAVGFGDVAEFTHQLENLVLKIQKNEIGLSSEIVTTLLKSNDRLVEMLAELKSNVSASFNNADLIQEIQVWLDNKTAPMAEPIVVAEPASADPAAEKISLDIVAEEILEPAPNAPPANSFFETPVEELTPPPPPIEAPLKAPEANETKVEPKAEVKGESKNKEKEDEIIRVSLSKIDLLNDYVGELIVLQSVIQQQTSQDKLDKLPESLRQMAKLSKDIQHLSMSLRMLPVKPLIQKLQRVVRDTARTLDKMVNFETIGEHLDIDKSVLDRLADPLIHILRNAVDHGLETTEKRTESGKNAEGHVRLSFSNEGNHLVVEISDDGKGIDSQIIKKKAIEKKLISETQSLTERQLIHLVFHPGFSTKSETSEISGRGVGMDVVKTNVEKIGGQVDIQTQVGKGSVFRMQIPLSLAVIEGLVVTSDTNRYVIPLNQVQETINLKSQKLYPSKLGIGSCFELRGSVVPLFNIEDTLGVKPTSLAATANTGLIINVGDKLISIAVKDILRAQQVVIKPLGNGIPPQKGWLGSCVLGDGLPTLIVSPVDLLEGKISEKIVNPAIGSKI